MDGTRAHFNTSCELVPQLVKTEVERERSAIFQAIDYIVESDFFEGGNVDDNVAHVVDDHEDEQDEEDDDASSNSESTDVDDDDDDDTDSTDDLINDDDDLELDDDPDIPPPASTMAPISLADSLN